MTVTIKSMRLRTCCREERRARSTSPSPSSFSQPRACPRWSGPCPPQSGQVVLFIPAYDNVIHLAPQLSPRETFFLAWYSLVFFFYVFFWQYLLYDGVDASVTSLEARVTRVWNEKSRYCRDEKNNNNNKFRAYLGVKFEFRRDFVLRDERTSDAAVCKGRPDNLMQKVVLKFKQWCAHEHHV